MERRNPLFLISKKAAQLCWNLLRVWKGPWARQLHGGLSAQRNIFCCSRLPHSGFFFLSSTHCHTRAAPSRRSRRSAGGVVDLSNVTGRPRLHSNSDNATITWHFWGRRKRKKMTFVLHWRKQIAVGVFPVAFPALAARPCCCLELLAGEGGVIARPWPLLWERYRYPLWHHNVLCLSLAGKNAKYLSFMLINISLQYCDILSILWIVLAATYRQVLRPAKLSQMTSSTCGKRTRTPRLRSNLCRVSHIVLEPKLLSSMNGTLKDCRSCDGVELQTGAGKVSHRM